MKGLQMTKQAFEDEWWKYVQTGMSYTHAYNTLERWHMETFGNYRYSSYESFTQVRNRKKPKI